MDIKITTIFDNFFRYQLDMKSIADWFKNKHLDSFTKVMAYLIAYFNREYIFDNTKKKVTGNAMYEFEKALAYHICRINGII